MSSTFATRTKVSYFGQPRASLISTPFGVPQAGSDGTIDPSWLSGGGGGVSSLIAGSGITLSPPGGTGDVTISASAGGGTNNYATATNNTGNTTVTPDVPNYDLGLNVTGSARTSIIILDTAGRGAGDAIKLVITLPATAAIVLEVRNATAGGTLLLPAEIFPAQQFTTDGVVLSATWEFVFTGAAWKYVLSNIPA